MSKNNTFGGWSFDWRDQALHGSLPAPFQQSHLATLIYTYTIHGLFIYFFCMLCHYEMVGYYETVGLIKLFKKKNKKK